MLAAASETLTSTTLKLDAQVVTQVLERSAG